MEDLDAITKRMRMLKESRDFIQKKRIPDLSFATLIYGILDSDILLLFVLGTLANVANVTIGVILLVLVRVIASNILVKKYSGSFTIWGNLQMIRNLLREKRETDKKIREEVVCLFDRVSELEDKKLTSDKDITSNIEKELRVPSQYIDSEGKIKKKVRKR